jgi:hypothetical protein
MFYFSVRKKATFQCEKRATFQCEKKATIECKKEPNFGAKKATIDFFQRKQNVLPRKRH